MCENVDQRQTPRKTEGGGISLNCQFDGPTLPFERCLPNANYEKGERPRFLADILLLSPRNLFVSRRTRRNFQIGGNAFQSNFAFPIGRFGQLISPLFSSCTISRNRLLSLPVVFGVRFAWFSAVKGRSSSLLFVCLNSSCVNEKIKKLKITVQNMSVQMKIGSFVGSARSRSVHPAS
jgi:hypothetical protein